MGFRRGKEICVLCKQSFVGREGSELGPKENSTK